VSATSLNQNGAAPLRLLAETAALFREECCALDHLAADLYRDIEQLRDELMRKGDELEEGRKKLAQRGAQLAEQRKESGRLVQLLEQQETRLAEALSEIKLLREQSQGAREPAAPAPDSNPALMTELAELRRQLTEAIAAAAAAAQAPPVVVTADGRPADEQTLGRVSALERERVELESELELVRTRATELQEVVNQQRRELVEQRADITTELRLLRELVEQRPQHAGEYEQDEDALVAAAAHSEPLGSSPDPVVSSVMAQFARLQKDVAQRRKKK